jgi:hypothetical protein
MICLRERSESCPGLRGVPSASNTAPGPPRDGIKGRFLSQGRLNKHRRRMVAAAVFSKVTAVVIAGVIFTCLFPSQSCQPETGHVRRYNPQRATWRSLIGGSMALGRALVQVSDNCPSPLSPPLSPPLVPAAACASQTARCCMSSSFTFSVVLSSAGAAEQQSAQTWPSARAASRALPPLSSPPSHCQIPLEGPCPWEPIAGVQCAEGSTRLALAVARRSCPQDAPHLAACPYCLAHRCSSSLTVTKLARMACCPFP